MPNRLSKESSPYLQQHSDNPVDWYPWGSEALERARAEDKPILLSIGYAACHWCHVMAHESFEDEKTAQVMNEKFINIKVDREERPDIDAIYMQAVQALTGHGGWPMTMFLLPDGSPFYGGTYYPPEDRQGLPSFRKILNAVADAYVKKRGDISKTSEQIKQIYKTTEQRAQSAGALSAHTLELAYRGLAQQYDGRNGGFGGAPKFPSTMCLDFLLRYSKRTGTGYAQEMALESFRKMARGGIYDQVGGGFHRYAVDAIWLVPHFEKMLYDNALLTRFGAHLWQATHDNEVRRVTEQTIEWVAREMTSPAGGFYSSLDADSEGHEGKFYVWEESELDQVLGNDSALVKQFFGATQAGNFEGKNILFRLNPVSAVAARVGITEAEVDRIISSARKTLYDERAKRVWPGRDEKILAGWNGLMLRGVATAARAFSRTDFKELAIRNAEFLAREIVREGRVMRSHKDGVTTIPGFLEDHAAVALGFISVYELTFDERWVRLAALIAEKTVEFFWEGDDSTGAFYDTARDAEKLITRPRDVTDNAIPSGNSLAIELLLHLAELKSESEMKRRATFALETLGPTIISYPMAFGHALGAADISVNGAIEVAISGLPGDGSFQQLLNELAGRYSPSLVLAGGESGKTTLALLKDHPTLKQAATAYVCRGYICDTPTDDPKLFGEQIESAAKSR